MVPNVVVHPRSIMTNRDFISCSICGNHGLVVLQHPTNKILGLCCCESFWWQGEKVSMFGLMLSSARFNLPPKHLRGPAKNGWYDQSTILLCLITSSFHLSGRNLSASWPYRSRFRCTAKVEKATRVPFGTRMGSSPLLPPPRGRNVSSVEKRPFNGTGGNNRRAARET